MTSRAQRLAPSPGLTALTALGVASALAWVYLIQPPAMAVSMSSGMAGMPMMSTGPVVWSPAHAGDVLVMWAAMALAMMLPAATPALLRTAGTDTRAGRRVLVFAGGYLLFWLSFAVALTALQWVLERVGLLVDGVVNDRIVASGVIAAVGAWQLLPLKRSCLARCSSWTLPAEASGGWATAGTGMRYGLPCLGASGPLMLLPVATGLMSAPWLGLLTVWLVLERLSARGGQMATLGGLALIAYAAVRLA